MRRREFLNRSLFAATAGLALDACAPESYGVIPILLPEEPFVPGEESYLPSTCFECASACGLLVRKIDGRLVKVEGDPEDPASRGGVCARGQALPQAMYHPDRIRGPRMREGDRGSGTWKDVSWDEALDRIASAIGRAGATFGFLTGEIGGHRAAMVRRFTAALSGSHLVHEPFTTAPLKRAHRLATGHEALFDFDLSECSYLVSFGAEILESHVSPVRLARALAEMRQGRPGRRGKFVMVGPRLSLTAANADEWIPARPGAELDLALGVIAWILEKDLHDRELASYSTGLEGLRAFVAERGAPAAVAERTGIPLPRIEKLARELVENRPAVALAGGPSLRSSRGVALGLVASHVNAILGSYRGMSIAGAGPAFADWAEAPHASEPPRALATALVEGAAVPSVLFVVGTNPLHSLPPGFGLEERLRSSSLVVSFSSYPDETAEAADIVLPESMSFERFEDAVPETSPLAVARVSGPLLLRPIYDTRSMPDVLLALAKRLGRSESFPWESYEDALREAWTPVVSWDEALSRGSVSSEAPRVDFATPERRYRFATEPIEQVLDEDHKDELVLHVYPSAAFGDGRSAHLPFLQDLADPVTGARWGSVVEIAEADAARLSIRSGDLVEIRTGGGTVRAPAHVSPGLHPGVVALAAGQGHSAYGRYAGGVGVNAYSLFDTVSDEDGFHFSASGVEIRKGESAS